jgi:hypothetical protein
MSSFAEPYRFEHEGLGGLEDLHIVLVHAGCLDHVDQLRAAIDAGFPYIPVRIGQRMAGTPGASVTGLNTGRIAR